MWKKHKRSSSSATKKENLVVELQQERALRCDAEKKLEEMRNECDSCRLKVTKLQDDFRRMEDIVRGMLAYKAKFDQIKMDKLNTAQSYEAKIKKYEICVENLQKENMLLIEELKNLETKSRDEMQEKGFSQILLERLQYLEEENSSLALENDQQRHQYEQCLDDVANQVVQALLSQKTLREECRKLQMRVTDLEQQNKSLSNVFLHRLSDRSQSIELRSRHSAIDPRARLFSPAAHQQSSLARYSFPGSYCSKASTTDRVDAQLGQSDHSSESLASMCSDYSANSSASSCANIFRSQSGNQRPSSPPAWFHETEIWPEHNRIAGDNNFSLFQKYPNCSTRRSKQYNPDSYSGDEKSVFCKEVCPRRYPVDRLEVEPRGKLNNLNCVETLNRNMFETVMRCQPNCVSSSYKNSTPTPNCNQSPSEFFDSGLDAVETPNDDLIAAENLEIPYTNTEAITNKMAVPVLLSSSLNGLQRPTSLNLAADQSADELKCLKCKQHELNNDGNVYVEPNKSITQVLHVGQLDSSNMLGNAYGNNQYLTKSNFSGEEDVLVGVETPYCDTSLERNELGTKDEGYSTMSSDVQGVELGNRAVDNAQDAVTKQLAERRPFYDVINKEEMKEICEEDETDDNCSNFARDLATSVVKQDGSAKSTMELLNARSSNLISLFSPQGFKNKSAEAHPGDMISSGGDIFNHSLSNSFSNKTKCGDDSKNAEKLAKTSISQVLLPQGYPIRHASHKERARHAHLSSSLSRANSDSKIYIDHKVLHSDFKKLNSGQRSDDLGGRLCTTMTQSYDETFGLKYPTTSSMRRSQCQILSKLRASLSASTCQIESPRHTRVADKTTENKEAVPVAATVDASHNESRKWIWEWEPPNSQAISSDLNATDAGFFMTSLPPLSKIQEDGGNRSNKRLSLQSDSFLNDAPTSAYSHSNLFIGSSPELSRRCNSPDENYQSSSLRKTKKVASVPPFNKYETCDSDRVDVSSCNSRLSWCSEELTLTSVDTCPSLPKKLSASITHYSLENVNANGTISTDEGDVYDASTVDGPETKFTSDYYRLCPVESNRSLQKSNVDAPRETDLTKVPYSNKNVVEQSSISKTKDADARAVQPVASSTERSAKSAESSPAKSSPSKTPTKSAIPVPKKLRHPSCDQKLPCDAPSTGVKKKVIRSPVKSKPKKESPAHAVKNESDGVEKKAAGDSKIPTRKAKCRQPEVATKIPQRRALVKEGSPCKSTSEQIRELNQMLSLCGETDEVLEVKAPKPCKPPRRQSARNKRGRKNKEGCVTSWVHVEADVDLSDPRARANLLDSMLASSSSSERSSSSDDDTIAERQHLHALHRFRRRKKRAVESNKEQVLRYIPPIRPSIMNCPEFFYRYGEKEQEAVSYFDFLDELSTSTPSSGDFDDEHDPREASFVNSYELYKSSQSSDSDSTSISEDKLLSPIAEESYEVEDARGAKYMGHQTFSLLLQSSQEYDVNRLSFSDSCAESFSSSNHSFTATNFDE